MEFRALTAARLALSGALCSAGVQGAAQPQSGNAGAAAPASLLFWYSASQGLDADGAGGERRPNFADKVKVVPNGYQGAALAAARVSWNAPHIPSPQDWTHLAFSWDETRGSRLYVNGTVVVHREAVTLLDAAVDQFGPHSRIISPHQVQSAYSYLRGGDIDEVRIYDHQLDDSAVAALAHGQQPDITPQGPRELAIAAWRDAWWFRYGWNRPGDLPPYLSSAATRIRKVEFVDARDLKERMTGANDGIAETTWRGVYNRSRLAERHDGNVSLLSGHAGPGVLEPAV